MKAIQTLKGAELKIKKASTYSYYYKQINETRNADKRTAGNTSHFISFRYLNVTYIANSRQFLNETLNTAWFLLPSSIFELIPDPLLNNLQYSNSLELQRSLPVWSNNEVR